jgi:hypothetical protein
VARSGIDFARLEIETLRLAPGSHSSPQEGVCVVELASLLGGESFSDRPRCVCPVIAGFLRSFNDRASHADRQRLAPYADRAVGSRADRRVTHTRRDACLVTAGVDPGGGRLRRLLQRLVVRFRIWIAIGPREALQLDEGAGEYAARVAVANRRTEGAFALLDRLLEIGTPPEAAGIEPAAAPSNGGGLEAAPLADPVEAAAKARVAAAIRQLAGDAEVAEQENGRKRANHNGNGRHLGGRDSRNGHEEHVEHDHAHYGDPEREAKPANDPHDLARVP